MGHPGGEHRVREVGGRAARVTDDEPGQEAAGVGGGVVDRGPQPGSQPLGASGHPPRRCEDAQTPGHGEGRHPVVRPVRGPEPPAHEDRCAPGRVTQHSAAGEQDRRRRVGGQPAPGDPPHRARPEHAGLAPARADLDGVAGEDHLGLDGGPLAGQRHDAAPLAHSALGQGRHLEQHDEGESEDERPPGRRRGPRPPRATAAGPEQGRRHDAPPDEQPAGARAGAEHDRRDTPRPDGRREEPQVRAVAVGVVEVDVVDMDRGDPDGAAGAPGGLMA